MGKYNSKVPLQKMTTQPPRTSFIFMIKFIKKILTEKAKNNGLFNPSLLNIFLFVIHQNLMIKKLKNKFQKTPFKLPQNNLSYFSLKNFLGAFFYFRSYFLLTLSVFLLMTYGCSGQKIPEEEKIIKAIHYMETHKSTQLSVDFTGIQDLRKICIQGPYTPENIFREYSNENPAHYIEANEEEYYIWFFFAKSMQSKVRIDRFKQMEKTKGSVSCSGNLKIFLEQELNSSLKFSIRR
jgi:hypothetical protein